MEEETNSDTEMNMPSPPFEQGATGFSKTLNLVNTDKEGPDGLELKSPEHSEYSAVETYNNPRHTILKREEELLSSLMQENLSLKSATICKVCMDNHINVVLLPCRHLICCDNCSRQVSQCPLCRTDIIGTVQTHL